jgi:GNAT superfamily N-acetyltransferase
LGEISKISLLTAGHGTEAFDCGDDDLNFWLKNKALVAQLSRTARTYVLTANEQVLGYYILSLGRVARQELPRPMRRDMPGHPIPLVLLARLAVDASMQGRGIGRALVKDAFNKGLEVARIAGGIGLFVEAKSSEVEGFYASLGFLKPPAFGGKLFLPYPRETDSQNGSE